MSSFSDNSHYISTSAMSRRILLFFLKKVFYLICTERMFLVLLCKPAKMSEKAVDNVENFVDNLLFRLFHSFFMWKTLLTYFAEFFKSLCKL